MLAFYFGLCYGGRNEMICPIVGIKWYYPVLFETEQTGELL
jgi:hypothetical protein